MAGSTQRFSFEKFKDHLPSRNAKNKKKPSASASMPNFGLAKKKFRTLGRSQSFKTHRDCAGAVMADEDGKVIRNQREGEQEQATTGDSVEGSITVSRVNG